MAVIDVAGFVADLKDHAVDHGFHVHDERHFVETYSLRQAWEVDLHPEDACGGPLDLHLSLEIDPRVTLVMPRLHRHSQWVAKDLEQLVDAGREAAERALAEYPVVSERPLRASGDEADPTA